MVAFTATLQKRRWDVKSKAAWQYFLTSWNNATGTLQQSYSRGYRPITRKWRYLQAFLIRCGNYTVDVTVYQEKRYIQTLLSGCRNHTLYVTDYQKATLYRNVTHRLWQSYSGRCILPESNVIHKRYWNVVAITQWTLQITRKWRYSQNFLARCGNLTVDVTYYQKWRYIHSLLSRCGNLTV